MRGKKTMGRKRNQNGAALPVAIAALVFIIVPMAGLAVDVGIIYAVRSRLQSSVDGAALAAARALTLGSTITSQESTARQNAVNWFYANFPNGTWATTGTVMSTSNVTIDDVSIPNLAKIQVTATTTVPTWFMKYLNFNSTVAGVTGQASRRDVVAMMVIDRSGSMNTTGSCTSLRSASKLFTGAFAEGRDRIGAVTFSDGIHLESAPSTSFQTVLGYSNNQGSGSGAIDSIVCGGGTGTAEAIMEGYNELFKIALPGALNVLVIETDGLPNTMTLRWSFNDGAAGHYWTNLVSRPFSGGVWPGCRDTAGKTLAQGGFGSSAVEPAWTAAKTMSTGGTPYMPNITAGMWGSFFSDDPGASPGETFNLINNPIHPSANNQGFLSESTPGCNFGGGLTNVPDLAWLPNTDVYGNSLKPALNPYKTAGLNTQAVVTPAGNINYLQFSGTQAQKWTTYHNAAINTMDNAGFRARQGFTLPSGDLLQPTIYFVGLGGNAGYTVDYTLMQRIANDFDGDPDPTHVPPLWLDCAHQPGCVNYPLTDNTYTQPQGSFVWATDQTKLGDAFREIASQVLRISK